MSQENYTVAMPRTVRDNSGRNQLQQYAASEPVVPVQQFSLRCKNNWLITVIEEEVNSLFENHHDK